MEPYWKTFERFVFVSDTPQPADIIFIAGNTHAEPAEHAADLWRRGFAPLILPSGRYAKGNSGFAGQSSGKTRYRGEFDTEWDFMKAVLCANGVPEDAILKENRATYTWQNATFSKAVLEDAGLKIGRALLCCMPVHARRAGLYYQAAFPDTEILVCPAPYSELNAVNWMKTRTGVDTVMGEIARCGSQFDQILYDTLEL